MTAMRFFLLLTVIGFCARDALTDIPAPPSREDACMGKTAGDDCRSNGWMDQFNGTCQAHKSRLLCSSKDNAIQPQNNADLAQSCTGLASAPVSMFSFISLLLGLFMAMKLRRR